MLAELSKEILKKNKQKITGAVEKYLTQHYSESIEKNLKRGELYKSFSEFSNAVEEMVEDFKEYFKITEVDSSHLWILKNFMYSKLMKAGMLMESLVKEQGIGKERELEMWVWSLESDLNEKKEDLLKLKESDLNRIASQDSEWL